MIPEYIYIITDGTISSRNEIDCKVGRALDPIKRRQTLNIGNLNDLKIIKLILVLNAPEVESSCHEILQRFKIRGEWFSIPVRVLNTMCRDDSWWDAIPGIQRASIIDELSIQYGLPGIPFTDDLDLAAAIYRKRKLEYKKMVELAELAELAINTKISAEEILEAHKRKKEEISKNEKIVEIATSKKNLINQTHKEAGSYLELDDLTLNKYLTQIFGSSFLNFVEHKWDTKLKVLYLSIAKLRMFFGVDYNTLRKKSLGGKLIKVDGKATRMLGFSLDYSINVNPVLCYTPLAKDPPE